MAKGDDVCTCFGEGKQSTPYDTNRGYGVPKAKTPKYTIRTQPQVQDLPYSYKANSNFSRERFQEAGGHVELDGILIFFRFRMNDVITFWIRVEVVCALVNDQQKYNQH